MKNSATSWIQVTSILYLKLKQLNVQINTIMKYSRDEEIADAVMAIIWFLGILFGACMIGLTMAILKPILLYFGIENNL